MLKGSRRALGKSRLEEKLFTQLSVLSGNWKLFPAPERNARDWCPGRKLELDFFWRGEKIGVEVQGGIWKAKCKSCGGIGRKKDGKTCGSCQGAGMALGKHGRGEGIEKDCEKLCLAATLGILVLPVTAKMINNPRDFSQAAIYCREVLGYERGRVDSRSGANDRGKS